MARRDFYASPFGVAYSTYMERPRLSRLISRVVWGGDSKPYYDNMSAVAEVADGGTIVDCPWGAGPTLRALHPDAEVRYVAVDLSPFLVRPGSGDFGQVGTEREVGGWLDDAGFKVSRMARSGPMLFSMIGFASSPGTAVLPTWCMPPTIHSPIASDTAVRSASNRAGQVGS